MGDFADGGAGTDSGGVAAAGDEVAADPKVDRTGVGSDSAGRGFSAAGGNGGGETKGGGGVLWKVEMSRDSRQVKFFADSPEVGEPGCVCSYCGERIEEVPEGEEEPIEIEKCYEGQPIRMYKVSGGQTLEARFHGRCFAECLKLELFKMGKI